MNFNVVFYGLNKLYFAASVYAEEHNIFHSPHLVSQGEERPQPNLTSGVIIFFFFFSPPLVCAQDTLRWNIERHRERREGCVWFSVGGGGVLMGDAHMCCDDPWRTVHHLVLDKAIHNPEGVIFQHLCQYISISVPSLAELHGDSEPVAFNQLQWTCLPNWKIWQSIHPDRN